MTDRQAMLLSRGAVVIAALLAVVAVAGNVARTNRTVDVARPAEALRTEGLVSALERRLRVNPGEVESWQRLGQVLMVAERPGEAAFAYRRAVVLAPDDAALWSAYGEATVLSGDGTISNIARTAFRRATSIDPNDTRARYFLATAKALGGDPGGAVDDWLAMLASAPANAPWVPGVRRAIAEVAAANGIDVTARRVRLVR